MLRAFWSYHHGRPSIGMEHCCPGKDVVKFLCLMQMHRVMQPLAPKGDVGAGVIRQEMSSRPQKFEPAIAVQKIAPYLGFGICLLPVRYASGRSYRANDLRSLRRNGRLHLLDQWDGRDPKWHQTVSLGRIRPDDELVQRRSGADKSTRCRDQPV